MSFELSHELMLRLCASNSFTVPGDRMVFFGLRGCLNGNTAAQFGIIDWPTVDGS